MAASRTQRTFSFVNVRFVPRAESGAPEVATFLIKGVDHHKNDCIPVIADFVLCGEKINLNMSMG
jgi:hypothetical protein